MAYTTLSNISAELNGVVIDNSTTPTDTEVDNWITESDAEIDQRTGKRWETQIETDIIIDYDGSGYVRLPHAPIISITSFEVNDAVLGQADDFRTLTEGRDSDFIVYSGDGEIKFFGSNLPNSGYNRIKTSYSHGFSTVPGYITRLSTLMTTKRFIQSTVFASAKEEGGSVTVGNISISDPSDFSSQQLRDIDDEVQDLFSKHYGTTHVFRGSRLYRPR